MTTPIFYLNIQSIACTAEVRLNDAPMFTLVREHDQRALPTISEWVINGENLLELRVYDTGAGEAGAGEAGAGEAGAGEAGAGAAPRVRVALCQASLADVPEPGNELELMVLEWPPPAVPGEVAQALPQLPMALQQVALVQQPWGRWSWQDAPPFAADARTTTAVIDYVRDLHATLAAGSVDALIAHSQVKFREVAPAYDMTPADAILRIQRAWQGLRSHADFQLADFDEGDLDLRLHCGGRLVEPTTLAGEPIVRQARAIDDERWSLPVFIARTNWDVLVGNLTIVR